MLHLHMQVARHASMHVAARCLQLELDYWSPPGAASHHGDHYGMINDAQRLKPQA